MNWLAQNGGWAVALLTLALAGLNQWRLREIKRVVAETGLTALVAKVDRLADELHSLGERMDAQSQEFWREKWPAVERVVARMEVLEQRVSRLEDWRDDGVVQ